jgi:hypothetical protein
VFIFAGVFGFQAYQEYRLSQIAPLTSDSRAESIIYTLETAKFGFVFNIDNNPLPEMRITNKDGYSTSFNLEYINKGNLKLFLQESWDLQSATEGTAFFAPKESCKYLDLVMPRATLIVDQTAQQLVVNQLECYSDTKEIIDL